MSRELLQQALDALETKYSDYIYDGAGSAIAGAFEDDVAALRAALAQPAPAVPVDMVLHCPACGLQHIDAPDPWVAKYGEELCKAKGFSLWTNPPHKSHLCRGCGHVWRPADVATAGVKAVSTKGKEDGPIKEPVARQTLPAPAVPDGWVMVPREPTPEMRRVGADVWHLHDGHLTRVIGDVYRAMIAAASGSAPAVREQPDTAILEKALRRAFSLGQTYWQQADSDSYKENKRSDETRQKFETLIVETLSGITGDSAPAVQPLTNEQIDEIWDGTFDSADPKRQLSFRQIITRAIERAHGITGDSNG